MSTQAELKVKFIEMCKFIEVSNNKVVCIFEDIEDHSELTSDEDYPILKEKMVKILDLVNKNESLIFRDIETELWDMV